MTISPIRARKSSPATGEPPGSPHSKKSTLFATRSSTEFPPHPIRQYRADPFPVPFRELAPHQGLRPSLMTVSRDDGSADDDSTRRKPHGRQLEKAPPPPLSRQVHPTARSSLLQRPDRQPNSLRTPPGGSVSTDSQCHSGNSPPPKSSTHARRPTRPQTSPKSSLNPPHFPSLRPTTPCVIFIAGPSRKWTHSCVSERQVPGRPGLA